MAKSNFGRKCESDNFQDTSGYCFGLGGAHTGSLYNTVERFFLIVRGEMGSRGLNGFSSFRLNVGANAEMPK